MLKFICTSPKKDWMFDERKLRRMCKYGLLEEFRGTENKFMGKKLIKIVLFCDLLLSTRLLIWTC